MQGKHKCSVNRDLYKNIGNRVLIKRRELHYTQEQMAEILGVSSGFYGMIERGEKAPSIEKLIIIYEELGIDITYLLTGQSTMSLLQSAIPTKNKKSHYLLLHIRAFYEFALHISQL